MCKTFTLKQRKTWHFEKWFKKLEVMCVSVSKGKPRSLQHLCRLVIRSHMSLRTLNDPETMAAGPFPPRLMNYLTYRERDLYGDLLSVWNTFYLYMWLKCENSQSAHLMQYLISVVFLQTELKTKKWMSSIWNRCPSHKCFSSCMRRAEQVWPGPGPLQGDVC